MDLSPAPDDAVVVVRSHWGRLGFAAACLTAAGFCGVSLAHGDIRGTVQAVPFIGTVLLVTASLWFWPRLEFRADRLVVANPLRSWTIPWQAVTGVDSRLGLSLRLHGRRVHSWAAPARSVARAEDRRVTIPRLRPGRQVCDLDAHDAAALAQELREAAAARPTTDAPIAPNARWQLDRLAALAVCLLGCLVVLLG